MNATHSPLSKTVWGALGFTGCFLITGRLALAREVRDLYVRDEFKTGFRRMAWYFRRGWTNLDVSQDHMYDFTEGFNAAQLTALESFIEGRKARTPDSIHHCDLLYVHGRRLTLNEDTQNLDAKLAAFSTQADHVLALVPKDIMGDLKETTADINERAGDFSAQSATEALVDFGALFPINEVPWYVISGTLLGLIREGGFLEHDYDIDLGIHAEQMDLDRILEALQNSESFVVRKNDIQHEMRRDEAGMLERTTKPVLLKILHVNGLSIDLFIHYKEGKTRWHGSSIHRWNNTDFDLAPYTLCGQPVLGPANAELYLTENYGDWRTPVTDFNCTVDTTNQGVVCHPPSIALFFRRMVLAWFSKDADAQKLCQLLMHSGYLTTGTTQMHINPNWV